MVTWWRGLSPAARDSKTLRLVVCYFLGRRRSLGEGRARPPRRATSGLRRSLAYDIGGHLGLDPGLTARKEGGRFILNGSKSFSTGALVADSIIVAFPHDEKTYLTALPRETPGLRPNDDWDNIGQRLTVSGSVSFDNVAVPEDALIGDAIGHDAPPKPKATIFIPLVQAAFAHFYLGIAEGALNAAARYTREQGRAWFKSGVAAATDDPIIQVQYGELPSLPLRSLWRAPSPIGCRRRSIATRL
jgi:alkylation response protein AidB-like acyl-CoA dehydrogenase